MGGLGAMSVFRKVVDEGSFSAAAAELMLSVAAVSKQVARLEESLGVRLLNRTTRQISLTEAGAMYYERTQRLLAEVEEIERELAQLQVSPRGILRVSAPMSFGLAYVAPLVADFLRPYPDLTLDLSFNDRFVDLLEEGVDLGIRIGELPDSSLVTRRLGAVQRLVVAAPAYLEAHGVPATIDELTSHRCLLYALQRTGDVWRFLTAFGPRDIPVSGPLRSNSGEANLQACRAGLGIALLPDFIAGPDVAAGRLVELKFAVQDMETGVHAVFPPGRFMPAKTRLFIDFLAARYAGQPWSCPRQPTDAPSTPPGRATRPRA